MEYTIAYLLIGFITTSWLKHNYPNDVPETFTFLLGILLWPIWIISNIVGWYESR